MKFHERFNIKIDITEAKKRFVNRAYNLIFLPYSNRYHQRSLNLSSIVATTLGKKYHPHESGIYYYITDDFYDNLHAIEGFSDSVKNNPILIGDLNGIVNKLLYESEVDLGITWNNGKFKPSGAKILDEKLVNENLKWLSEKKYINVLGPFEKGLTHFLYSNKRPELLSDVITDMYEALEALAKIITGKENNDLSANRELFIKTVKASDEYKTILNDYISYANNFRHAAKKDLNKPHLNIKEVESFIYLTGLLIRLAMR